MNAKIGVPVVFRLVNCTEFSYTVQVAEAAFWRPETVFNAPLLEQGAVAEAGFLSVQRRFRLSGRLPDMGA